MEFQEVFAQLRQRTGLSQSEVAERLFVTRQAVSRWERGETIPEVETLQRCQGCSACPSTPCWAVPGPGLPELWNAAER